MEVVVSDFTEVATQGNRKIERVQEIILRVFFLSLSGHGAAQQQEDTGTETKPPHKPNEVQDLKGEKSKKGTILFTFNR